MQSTKIYILYLILNMYKGCLNYNVLYFPPFQTRVVEEGMRDYKKGCLDKDIYVESIL